MRFIGCKTLLLGDIKAVVDRHADGAGTFCDIFSGTAAVARYFKRFYEVTSNDLLYFSFCLQRGTVGADEAPTFAALNKATGIADPIRYFATLPNEKMESLPQERRFFQNSYAPTGGRMYLTDSNALSFDFVRNTVEDWRKAGLLGDDEYFYLVACAVEGLPFVSNINGTYGAYGKKWDKRSGKVYEPLSLEITPNGRNNRCFNEDGAELLKRVSGDILYIDPPYNARQYLPNYHVLETAAKYDFPVLHGTTGLRDYEGQKSAFCSKAKAVTAFERLIKNAQFRHIVLSYNTEGIMPVAEIERVMKGYGLARTFEVTEIPYRRFKSRETSFSDTLKELIIYIEKEV